MVERIRSMADGSQSPEINPSPPSSSTEPSVVVSSETTRPASQNLLSRLLGRGRPQATELVAPTRSSTGQDAFVADIEQRAVQAREKGLPMPIAGGAEPPPGPRLYLADASGNVTGTIDVGRRATVAASIPPGGIPPRPPEGPPSMPNPEQPELPPEEYEFSAERGREIVEKIIELRTGMAYEERYEGENGRVLKQAYKELQAYVNNLCQRRHEIDPWNPRNAYPVQLISEEQFMAMPDDQRPPERPELSLQEVLARAIETRLSRVDPTILNQGVDVTQESWTDVRSLDALFSLYENPATSGAELALVEQELGKYFKAAKAKGLLKGADDILMSIYREDIQSGSSDGQVREIIARKIAFARRSAESAYKSKRSDPEIARLYGVWEPYLSWAEGRLEAELTNQEQLQPREGEWLLPRQESEEESVETFWRPSNYPDYYIVTAKTPAQFRTAKESFIQMIKNHSLGYSPDEIMPHLLNFKKALGLAGTEQVTAHERQPNGPDKVTPGFNEELRQEFEAEAFVWGADYNNETYNPKGYKDYMMAMTLHEGPARWTRLIRTGQGKVAAFTQMFDKDPLLQIYFNPGGERGELDIIAMHFLQSQVVQIAIERGVGIQLKDYDPRDANLVNNAQARLARAVELNGSDGRSFKVNLERIGIHRSDEELKSLYEGFENGNAHINNYERFKDLDENQLPLGLRESVVLGRIQVNINRLRTEIREGRERRSYNPIELLDSRDRRIYEGALAKAKSSFDIALQMQGVSGEKVRKGRGFFYVDRNPHIQSYTDVEERSLKIEWILSELEKFDKSKGKEGRQLKDFSEEMQHFYKGLTDKEKIKTPEGLYGIDDTRMSDSSRRSIQIGWILSEIRNGRALSTFTPDQRAVFSALSDIDKDVYVDHMPVYLAEKFVQCAVTRAKIQHSNSKASVRTEAANKARKYAIEQIKKYGLQATLELPKLKFNEDPNSENFGEVIGQDGVESITFQTATDSNNIYNRYTTHTYWGYQGENRHTLLAPHIFEAAKRIRAGISRPEDEDMLATQLLITDPTLKRVRKFEIEQVQREITLLQAAVEESFLGHTYINKDLFKSFLSKSGRAGRMRAGYDLEDWGGMMRFTMGIRELSATQPARFTRRLGSEIAIMPMYIDSMSAIWGQDGMMGAITMFADKINSISDQRMVGQFGITKFIDMQDYGVQLYNALIGTVHEGSHKEGLYMKPTNDNDALHVYSADAEKIENDPKTQWSFLQDLRKSYGRLEAVLKVMRPMYSDVRNAGGALRLENTDIFLDNGRFNPVIEEGSESGNTGTSRHLESDFYDEFAEWLTSDEPGGGGLAYPNELVWNRYLHEHRIVFKSLAMGSTSTPVTFKRWFFDKAGL